jgi:predicted amidohydrolase
MTITLLQTDIIWNSPLANQQKLGGWLRELEKSDLYVLPEMFSTGFATQPQGVAEADGSTLAWMQRMARELNAAICGKHINGRGISPENWGCCCYWDMEKGGFRSFRWANIIAVL